MAAEGEIDDFLYGGDAPPDAAPSQPIAQDESEMLGLAIVLYLLNVF
jgi:hypothetical protein